MKTRNRHRNRAFCASFVVSAVAVIAFVAAAALPQAAQAQSQSSAVAVLQSEMTDVKAAIIRIDERLNRMDEKFTKRFGSVEQSIVRLDEKVNGLQMQNQFVIIPLLLLLVATMFGLLTKGTYWGRERASNPSAVARAPGASAGVSPGLGAAS
ncbi:MAG: hypothetical protein OXU62_11095 [Gammaproteobacteria bacterium]|nr:hypothetical protein [Gammaproteobacteria bacterium]